MPYNFLIDKKSKLYQYTQKIAPKNPLQTKNFKTAKEKTLENPFQSKNFKTAKKTLQNQQNSTPKQLLAISTKTKPNCWRSGRKKRAKITSIFALINCPEPAALIPIV